MNFSHKQQITCICACLGIEIRQNKQINIAIRNDLANCRSQEREYSYNNGENNKKCNTNIF